MFQVNSVNKQQYLKYMALEITSASMNFVRLEHTYAFEITTSCKPYTAFRAMLPIVTYRVGTNVASAHKWSTAAAHHALP